VANLQVTWPKSKKVIHGRLFVASGWADETLIGVFGECRPRSAPGPVIRGRTVAYTMAEPQMGQRPYYRWMIAFRLPDKGRYELRVTGLTDQGRIEVQNRDLVARIPFAITTTSPENNDDISADASDFAPYGELTVNPLGTVTMTDTQNNVLNPTYQYGDCTDLDIWTAQFPTIPSGTWTLRAADNTGTNVSTVTGLVVN
jgi:hypothetical protein